MRNIAIIQEYVPAYRVSLFRELEKLITSTGNNLEVYAGTPGGELRKRGDQSDSYSAELRSNSLNLPTGKTIRFQHIRSAVRNADLVIAELSTLNTTTWRLAATKSTKLVLWGHGGAFVQRGSLLRTAVESSLAKRASHVMTYSQIGRRLLINAGLHPGKVTCVGNSTDTESLRELFSKTEVSREPSRFFYVGALDRSKRIPFLLRAAESARTQDRNFHLTIYGKGEDEGYVKEYCDGKEYLTYAGVAKQEDLAREAARSSAIWMPGRVGLVAIDALALSLPVFSTAFDYHAPELECLHEGSSLFTLPDNPTEFGRQAIAKSSSFGRKLPEWNYPTIQSVASSITAVVDLVLSGRNGEQGHA